VSRGVCVARHRRRWGFAGCHQGTGWASWGPGRSRHRSEGSGSKWAAKERAAGPVMVLIWCSSSSQQQHRQEGCAGSDLAVERWV
jgi:hypothetical protein